MNTLLSFVFLMSLAAAEGHQIEQHAASASTTVDRRMASLEMECTPLDKPVVTFDQKVKTAVSVSGNQIKFTPGLNDGVGITASYTCP